MTMAMSKAKTVAGYLKELPPDRRKAVSKVRNVIRKNLPKGYSEMMGYGMIMYGIPLSKYPNTYNKQPLCYAALAAQKNFNSLYMMTAYAPGNHKEKLIAAFKKVGKKLDMGKSCIHFKDPDDLPLDAIGELVSAIPPEKWIQIYESSRKK
jgi:hypothetical protein